MGKKLRRNLSVQTIELCNGQFSSKNHQNCELLTPNNDSTISDIINSILVIILLQCGVTQCKGNKLLMHYSGPAFTPLHIQYSVHSLYSVQMKNFTQLWFSCEAKL